MASTSGATSGAAVHVAGLKEFRRELRQLENPRRWAKELAGEQREIAKRAASWAQAEAASMGGPFAKFRRHIKGRGGITGARIQIDSKANAVFWGAKKRTGWNARNPGSAPQHPEWVGAGWDVAVRGQGPYAINAAVADHVDEIVGLYAAAIDRVAASASNYWTATF